MDIQMLLTNSKISDYTIIKNIGKKVDKAKDKDNKLVIIKHLEYNNYMENISAKYEIYHHNKLNNSDYICKLYECFLNNRIYYMVMEYIDIDLYGYLLKNHIGKCEILDIFYECVKAIEYCHNNGVLHLDIKLENFLIDLETKRVKLIDFGFSQSKINKTTTRSGTLEYMSPEIFNRMETSDKTDVWALGVLICELSSNLECQPFYFNCGVNDDRLIVRDNVLSLNYNLDYVPKYVQDLVVNIFRYNQSDRIGIVDLLNWIGDQ